MPFARNDLAFCAISQNILTTHVILYLLVDLVNILRIIESEAPRLNSDILHSSVAGSSKPQWSVQILDCVYGDTGCFCCFDRRGEFMNAGI